MATLEEEAALELEEAALELEEAALELEEAYPATNEDYKIMQMARNTLTDFIWIFYINYKEEYNLSNKFKFLLNHYLLM